MVTMDSWLEAQQAVIGAALIDSTVIPAIMAGTTEADFSGHCRTVYLAMRTVFNSGRAVDPVTVNAQLGAGYTDYLLGLMEMTPSAANVETYIGLCRDRGRLMRLRELGAMLQDADDLDSAAALVEQAGQAMASRAGLQVVTMDDAMRRFFDRHTGTKEYLTWPIDGLDKMLYAESGDFIVIGGYPSDGKSAFALQIAYHLAMSKRVGFFSLETNPDKLFDRMMAHATGIPMTRIKTNALTENDWTHAAQTSASVLQRRLEYIPAAGRTVSDIRAISIANRYDVIIVDYLQLVSGSGRDRFSAVTDVSIGLHTMAQSTGITVIALAQLNRPEPVRIKRNKHPETPTETVIPAPELRNLRESGQIEQDADIVFMLYRPRPEETDRMLLIRKNKEGTLGSISLGFSGQSQTFFKKFDRLPDDYPVPFE